MAAIAFLERRNWNKEKVDFTKFFIGVMQSLAYNEARKVAETQPQYVRVEFPRFSGHYAKPA